MSNSHASPVNLAHRLGSLTAALMDLETHPETEPAARQLVSLMRASSDVREMMELAQAASQAERAPSGEFSGRLRNLISIVKTEIARQESITSLVLVVSSDVTLSYPLQVSLKQHHYDVAVVDCARKAVAFIDANPVAFCIIDLVLPDMDGRLLIADLRAKPATAAMPIIMISPRGISDISAHNTQQEGSFEKPVNPADIAD